MVVHTQSQQDMFGITDQREVEGIEGVGSGITSIRIGINSFLRDQGCADFGIRYAKNCDTSPVSIRGSWSPMHWRLRELRYAKNHFKLKGTSCHAFGE